MSNFYSRVVLFSILFFIFFSVKEVIAQQNPPGNTTPACFRAVHDSDCGTSADHGSQTCTCEGGGETNIQVSRTIAGNTRVCDAAVGEGFSGCVEEGAEVCEMEIQYECGGDDGCTAVAIGDPVSTGFCCPSAQLSDPACNAVAQ